MTSINIRLVQFEEHNGLAWYTDETGNRYVRIATTPPLPILPRQAEEAVPKYDDSAIEAKKLKPIVKAHTIDDAKSGQVEKKGLSTSALGAVLEPDFSHANVSPARQKQRRLQELQEHRRNTTLRSLHLKVAFQINTVENVIAYMSIAMMMMPIIGPIPQRRFIFPSSSCSNASYTLSKTLAGPGRSSHLASGSSTLARGTLSSFRTIISTTSPMLHYSFACSYAKSRLDPHMDRQ